MNLGMFCMPLHRAEKPWQSALEEDRQAVILADRLGFSEVWIGEHYSTKAEQIPSPMMLFASVASEAPSIRFGTGVINLPHHHPVIVAAEAAQCDHLTGGRLMVGIGPGGLPSDAELFGHEDHALRYEAMLEGLAVMLRLWEGDAPLRHEGKHFPMSLEKNVWLPYGIGCFPRPLQQPHPPIAMAMVAPGGYTAQLVAERDYIPISANWIDVDTLKKQWAVYAAKRDELGKPADPAVWRVCRNILVTESDAQAEDILADPDGVFAHYFRYLRGLRHLAETGTLAEGSLAEVNALLDIERTVRSVVIAGSARTVTERLAALVDTIGPFGTLVMVGHDWDAGDLWQGSMRRLAEEVAPRLREHADARRAG
ncbi:MAG: LLM class flavin-dependent oxidoreductase [Ectothiorhodospiraceae bacterium]|nr:LLM class flavin-dependent oxidoreductase [Ectothiorhodospiraceae bacterium]